jgi:hypothetical protein
MSHRVNTAGSCLLKGLALLLAGKRLRWIIPGFIQTQQYTGFARIKFRSRYDPADSLTIDSAIRKLATFVAELVYRGTDLRYLRPACEFQTVAGSKTAFPPAVVSGRDNNRRRRAIGIFVRETCHATRNQ